MSELGLSLSLWLVLVVAGAGLGVDAVSWPQIMVSRPIVAATIGGALLGDAASGFLVGAALEILGLGHTPYGAAVYPETGPAGLVAGAGLAVGGGAALGPLLVATACGWVIGWLGAVSVRWQRRLNDRLLSAPGLTAPPQRLERHHRLAMSLDAIRAGLLTAALAVPVMILVKLADGLPAGGDSAQIASSLLLAGLALAGGVGAGVMKRGRMVPLLLGAGAAIAALRIVVWG